MMTADSEVTPVRDAICNPAHPHHYMVLLSVTARVSVSKQETTLAQSTSALRLIEIGKQVYPPVLYLPEGDLVVDVTWSDKRTHCPLKGDARYFSFEGDELGWRYDAFDFASAISGHVAFYTAGLTICEVN